MPTTPLLPNRLLLNAVTSAKSLWNHFLAITHALSVRLKTRPLFFLSAVLVISVLAIWLLALVFPTGSTELQLHEVSRSTTTTFDVIFVHGLGGDWRETWDNGDPDGFWPEWLAEDCPNAQVWSLGYPASPTSSNYSMPLQDRSKSVIEVLKNEDLGQRPMYFVTHSLGGLVFKHAYRHLRDSRNPNDKKILTNCKGVIFLGTPHTGSNVATVAKMVSQLSGGWASDSLSDLIKDGGALRDLNEWYREHDDEITHAKVFYETEALPLVGKVVDYASADGGISVPLPATGNHFTICKPKSRQVQLYKSIRRFLGEFENDCLFAPVIGGEPSFDSLVSPAERVTHDEATEGARQSIGEFRISSANETSTSVVLWLLSHEDAQPRLSNQSAGGWVKVALSPGQKEEISSELALQSNSGWFYLFVECPPDKPFFFQKRCLGLHRSWNFRILGGAPDHVELSHSKTEPQTEDLVQ
ncbi:MAG: hypothetical protein R3C59_26180 [Planctomycetaceae bacterium]